MGKTGARLQSREVGSIFLESETDCSLDCTMDNSGGGDEETVWLSIVECLTCHIKTAVLKKSHSLPPQGHWQYLEALQIVTIGGATGI